MVIVVSPTQAIRVTTNMEEMARQGGVPISPLATPPAGQDPVPDSTGSPDATSESESQNAWEQFWSWLWGN
jgi:hypothetical protein